MRKRFSLCCTLVLICRAGCGESDSNTPFTMVRRWPTRVMRQRRATRAIRTQRMRWGSLKQAAARRCRAATWAKCGVVCGRRHRPEGISDVPGQGEDHDRARRLPVSCHSGVAAAGAVRDRALEAAGDVVVRLGGSLALPSDFGWAAVFGRPRNHSAKLEPGCRTTSAPNQAILDAATSTRTRRGAFGPQASVCGQGFTQRTTQTKTPRSCVGVCAGCGGWQGFCT